MRSTRRSSGDDDDRVTPAIVALCRAGFEVEAARDLGAIADRAVAAIECVASAGCGYVVARPDRIEALVDLQVATGFGGPSPMAADLVRGILGDGSYRRHLDALRRRLSRGRREAAALRDAHRFGNLPGGPVRDPDIPDVPMPDEHVQRLQGLLDWRQRVEAVHLVQVDMVEAEPLQARLAGRDEMGPRRPDPVRAAAVAHAAKNPWWPRRHRPGRRRGSSAPCP